MNEELKIIIKAFTDQAKKAVKEVKDEIEATGDAAKKNNKSISDIMKSIAKGATAVVGSIAAVITALKIFGERTKEAQEKKQKRASKNPEKERCKFYIRGNSVRK